MKWDCLPGLGKTELIRHIFRIQDFWDITLGNILKDCSALIFTVKQSKTSILQIYFPWI